MKLLIVEDELIIRKGLITSVDWAAYGITEIKDAKNGKIALEMMATFLPDIVITDIRMPVMDGLQLAEELGRLFENVQVIILSGYQDFSYAQRAMKLGITEYLTKPVGIEALGEVMERVQEKIASRRTDKQELSRLQTIYADNLEVICERWLNGLLHLEASLTAEQIAYGKQLGLELPGPSYQLLLIELEDVGQGKELGVEQVRQQYEQVADTAAGVLNGAFEFTAWYRVQTGICIIVSVKDEGKLYDTAVKIVTAVKETQAQTVLIGMSDVIDSLYELHHAYHQAKRAMGNRQHTGIGGVYVEAMDQSNMNHAIRTAIRYLESNYHAAITLEMMAKYAFVSPTYFSKLFKRETGESFVRWLNAYRIRQAKELLQENAAMPIYVIAEMVGIPNYKHFVKLFKEEVALTPSEYRERIQQ